MLPHGCFCVIEVEDKIGDAMQTAKSSSSVVDKPAGPISLHCHWQYTLSILLVINCKLSV